MAEPKNRTEVVELLAKLGRAGWLTGRDDLLLRTVQEVGALTLGQARRLCWMEASAVVAYQRLTKLRGWGLLRSTPLPPDMANWGLGPGPIYQLGPAGQLWLSPTATLDWQGRRGNWLEPLLGAELLTRLVTDRSGLTWSGPAAAQSQWNLEPPVTGAAHWAGGTVIFHLAGLIQPHLDWAELSRGFDRAVRGGRQSLPPVAILLRDGVMVSLVSELLDQRRRGPVTYLLAVWADLAGAGDLWAAPLWRQLPPEGEPVGRQSLAGLTSR